MVFGADSCAKALRFMNRPRAMRERVQMTVSAFSRPAHRAAPMRRRIEHAHCAPLGTIKSRMFNGLARPKELLQESAPEEDEWHRTRFTT